MPPKTSKTAIAVAPPLATITFHDRTGAATKAVRFALYDGAFEPADILLNDDKDETKNFAGSDSRRFFVRITDPASVNPTAKKKRIIAAAWRTFLDDKKTVRDDCSGHPTIALIETKPGSGVFESSWLIMVSDPWELDNVSTTTGRPMEGLRHRGQTDFRLRLGSVFDFAGVEFPEKSGHITFVPIFEQSPPSVASAEERRKIPLQIFVLGNIDSPALRAYILGPDLDNIRIVYARLGLWVFTAVDPAQAARVGVVRHSSGGESMLIVPMPAAVANPDLLFAADQAAVATAYPGLLLSGASGSPPPSTGGACATDTIRLFYVAGLIVAGTVANGATYEDRLFSNAATRSCSFVADSVPKVITGVGSAAAHEIGHSLTDSPSPDRHYAQPLPTKRLFERQNLMCFGPRAGGTGIASSQRLWDDADGVGLNQYSKIRSSRYTRGWLP